ncbi:hypothetical protein TorRG33x02_353630, partial [Trema orientale]
MSCDYATEERAQPSSRECCAAAQRSCTAVQPHFHQLHGCTRELCGRVTIYVALRGCA